MPRDLTPATRGIPATAEAWQSEAHDLRVLQKIAAAERVIYGRVTDQTARLIADSPMSNAAPDLLRALQVCQRELRGMGFKDDRITGALQMAARAVASATEGVQ